MPLLQFDRVSYSNDDKTILRDLTLTIDKGTFLTVIGPSGSGKSTFLKLCCHLISPTSGRILLEDTDLLEYSPTELRKTVAYCFQTPVLFGETVRDNLQFPYQIRNLKPDTDRMNLLFSRFNLTPDFAEQAVNKLSGGEKQRISLIRTLLFEPEILLLDEITSALDEDNTRIVEQAIETLHEEGVTVLWVTHNLEQSKRHADLRLTIEAGQVKALEALR